MEATIGAPIIRSVEQFHEQIAHALQFPAYYGKNLDALWEVLCDDIERPCTLTWLSATASRKAMPLEFRRIIQLFGEVALQDKENGVVPFELVLR